MSCRPSLDYVLYADGAMKAAEAGAFEDHLRTCADCRGAVDLLRSENEALSAALQSVPECSPKPLVTPATLFRNLAAAAALLYLPAWAISRQPLVRFAVPALLEHSQFMIALFVVLLAVTAVTLRFGLRRLRGLALLLALVVLPAGATKYRMGEVIRVDGDVKEDVFAFARRVEIRGTVRGRVFAIAQEIEVFGAVDRAVYAMGETVIIDSMAHIHGGLVVAGERATIAGGVDGALHFYGDRVTVTESARIAGPVTAKVDDGRLVRTPAGMIVAIDDGSARLTDPMVYLRRLAAFLAALVVALAAARLCPIAVEDSVIGLTRWWRSFATGVAIALIAPVAALILAVTLVGLPIAVLIVASLAVVIYAAKLLTAEFAGRLLLPGRPRVFQFVCGLALVFAAVELPFGIGGAVWGAVALSGLGALGSTVRRYFHSNRTF